MTHLPDYQEFVTTLHRNLSELAASGEIDLQIGEATRHFYEKDGKVHTGVQYRIMFSRDEGECENQELARASLQSQEHQ